MSEDKKEEGTLPPSDEEKSETTQAPEDKATDGTVYTKEMVHELRQENKKWRLKAKENLSSNLSAKENLSAMEERVTEAEKTSSKAMNLLEKHTKITDKRLIDSEIKTMASQYGLKKNKYLDLADKSKVVINEDGEINGAREMIEALKEEEPTFFELPSSGKMRQRPSTDGKTNAPPPIENMSNADARKEVELFIKNNKSNQIRKINQ